MAHDIFERIQLDHLNQLARLGESYPFRNAMEERDTATLEALARTLKKTAGFSFLRVVMLEKTDVMAAQEPVVGIEILAPGQLDALQPSLATSVRLPLVQTERARPTARRLEDRGMVIRARQPVLDFDGRVSAILDGGVLLNNNFAFVDAIRDLVYGPGSLPKGSIGTVTVFLDDVRISTNVPRLAGERALGTRVSDEVSHSVLDEGETWINRAFVVNDWYISAYEPIVDHQGKRVGILYAGYLEAPFRAALWKTLGVVLLLMFGLLALYAVLAMRGAKSIFQPVEQMSQVIRSTRTGGQQRVGRVASQDELAELAHEFDAMLDQLEQQTSADAGLGRTARRQGRRAHRRTAAAQRRTAAYHHCVARDPASNWSPRRNSRHSANSPPGSHTRSTTRPR